MGSTQAQDDYDYSDYLQHIPTYDGRWAIDLDAPSTSKQHPDYWYTRQNYSTLDSLKEDIGKGAPPVTAARLRRYEELGGDIEDVVDQIPDDFGDDE